MTNIKEAEAVYEIEKQQVLSSLLFPRQLWEKHIIKQQNGSGNSIAVFYIFYI